MRVLYFHQYFSTPRGTVGTRSYEMARRLTARGHQVLMICGSAVRGNTGLAVPFDGGRRRGTVDGIEVLEFDLAYSNRLGLIARTIVFLRFAFHSVVVALMEDYDVIFATTTPLTAGIPGIIAHWLRRKPFVFEVRDLWPQLPQAMGIIRNPLVLGAMSVLEWASYHSAVRLIGLAPGIVDGIANRGVARARVAMIPNGCDFDVFQGNSAAWRPRGVASDDLLAVFAGAHGVANGLDALVDAAIELDRRGRRDVKIVLVGEGKQKPHLEQRVAEAALTNILLHEPVSKVRLAGLLSATDIGLQILDNIPDFYDGTSPNKFFDYLSAGVAVLINYPGWLAKLVVENECGYAVAAEDAQALADALVHAADHRDDVVKMGSRAVELAHKHFDRRILADEFVNWIEGSIKA